MFEKYITVSKYKQLDIMVQKDYDNEFLKLIKQNKTLDEIKTILNINDKLIRELLKKYNVQLKKGPKIVKDKLSKYYTPEEEKTILNKIITLYIIKNLKGDEVCKQLNLKKHVFSKFIKKYNIKKDKNKILEITKQTNLKKYGVEWSAQNYLIKEKTKQTNLEKYGVENPYQSKEVKNKIKQQNIEKYGVEYCSQRPEIKEKIKNTQKEKYGKEIGFNSKKAKQTNLNKYGAEYVMQSNLIKNKYKLSIQNKYNNELINFSKFDYMMAWRHKKHGVNSGTYSDEFIISTLLSKLNLMHFILSLPIKERNLFHISLLFNMSIGYIKKYITLYDLNSLLYNDYYDSSYEIELVEYLKKYYNNITLHNKNIIYPKEIDILINDNLGIEFNGTWYHSSYNKSKYYHQEKSQQCENKGIRLIHIWEYEWLDLYTKEKILNLLMPNKIKIYARKCKIKEVSKKECDEFLNLYHLQNTCRGQKIKIGLYYNNELVQIMTFGNPRYNKTYEWELLRLCSHKDYMIIGGANKLFKYFILMYTPSNIISYCDFSKFSGKVYETLGMKYIKLSSPNKLWFKKNKIIKDSLLNQLGYDKLFNTNYGKGTSNQDLMLENGWLELFDSGNKIYEWRKNNG